MLLTVQMILGRERIEGELLRYGVAALSSDTTELAAGPGSAESRLSPLADSAGLRAYGQTLDSLIRQSDSLSADNLRMDSLVVDSLAVDSLGRPLYPADSVPPQPPIYHKPFLDDIITGKNQDSLIYDVRNRTVYIYEKGDITYQNMNMKGDFMRIDMETKEIYAYGRYDTVTKAPTRPVFTDGGNEFTMDTITYNIDTKKARIKGVATHDGEGFLTGARVKKVSDNVINIVSGRYTTCDAIHPHFFLAMSKAKVIQNKKVIIGPTYLVMEDVPIYFLGLPFGFFPTTNNRKSGFIVPEWGEEVVKGFFLRNGGYYMAFNDYVDMALTGGIYTLGSWEGALASRYLKRYRYAGAFNVRFSKDIVGERGAADYVNQNNFNVQWNHAQDPKFLPGSTFAASVNFSTSGYSKYSAQNMNDYLNSQTSSSVAYSKSWAGTPMSLSVSMSHSQNSRDTTISLSFPNAVFNVSRITPFRRKEAVGKERWYEKITTSYRGTLTNTVPAIHERELFSQKMFNSMRNGVSHVIPVSTSLNILKYLNVTPSGNYQERWYFRKIDRVWDPALRQQVNGDTTSGFFRLWDYNFSVGGATKIFGTYQFRKGAMIEAVRHTLTPSVSFNYSPDFASNKFGYYQMVQSDTLGNMTRYSPFRDGLFGVPSGSRSAAMSFSLQQSLEMKVRSKSDTTGVRKIKIIDNLGISSSYNFVADSLNLAPFSISFRTNLFKNVGLNISASVDPYQVDAKGQRINKFMLRKGSLGRLTSASTSFGYSFNSPKNGNSRPAANNINSALTADNTNFFEQSGFDQLEANARRALMTSTYYDFDIPWNFGFNYSFSYLNNGLTKNIIQTLGFQGSFSPTPKWGINFNGGFDFEKKQLTPGTISIMRDLHCWQMSFNWVPVGFRKSWSFTIGVKSSTLSDLKYDRRSSFFDNLYD